MASLIAASAMANPVGMTVKTGSATATQTGSSLNVRVSNGAALDWRSFNIQKGETTTFIQPSSTSVVWNRILDPNLSQVWGSINANGWVVLMNQNGFYFGPNSVINVHGLMVTTSPIAPESSGGGGLWQFNGTPPLASIVNYGEIHAEGGGSVFLISERIANHGTISAPGGTIGLYAGKEVLVSDRPDGRGISANVKLPSGSVDNSGKLIADGGAIALHAQVVNQNGLVQANSVRQHNGVIELVASESMNLGASSEIQARGDAVGASQGGSITIKSDRTFADTAGSHIDVSGGNEGGNGGSVEISASRMGSIHTRIDGSARPGWQGGKLLFDPLDIILGYDGSDTPPGSGNQLIVNSGDVPNQSSDDTLRLNVNSAFFGFSQIQLQARRDITLSAGTAWNLNDSTGVSAPGSMLTLEAGRNIVFEDRSSLIGGAGWSVTLRAGVVDFSSHLVPVQKGLGSILLDSGSGSLQTAEGSLSLEAGHAVLVGSGWIRTVGGGSINITTGDGDVNAGGNWDNPDNGQGYYLFTRFGYALRPDGIGGIGTQRGGDVTVNSGHNIVSEKPTIGAFLRSQDVASANPALQGNVTLNAANNISGKFIVSRGNGLIHAGGDLGNDSSPVSLSLMRGGWDVRAQNIYLHEVLNPNGSFNNNLTKLNGVSTAIRFQFDYAPDAYLHLTADDSVHLLGSNPAHVTENLDRPPIYPPQLTIAAGAGGVVLGSDVILYPSSQGKLEITTAGSLSSNPGSFAQLVMSDSDGKDYSNFATGHALTAVHVNDPDPVSLVINGDLQNLFIRAPKRADITIGGNALNFAFEGQNLSADDASHITIAGDYKSRIDRTFAVLSDLDQKTFDKVFTDPFDVADRDLAAHVTFNSLTHTLGFQGRMTTQQRDFLLHPMVLDVDPRTQVVKVDALGNPILVPASFTADAAAINKLYNDSQDIPSSGLAFAGLQIGGPGTLAISARNMELGISQGIRSVGTFFNGSLLDILYPKDSHGTRLAIPGADISLTLAGDLTMTSSQIASFNGGGISVEALAGKMNIGSSEQFTSDDTPKGIYTAHGGSVSVVAGGDINVNGSRIATYDGGDISVKVAPGGYVPNCPPGMEPVDGDVNAGAGARGFFTVATQQLNPKGELEVRNDQFFGSGIVAFTRPDSTARVGNISISARRDILAPSAGIVQLSFNRGDLDHSAIVDVSAGRNISIPSGLVGDVVTLHACGHIDGVVSAAQFKVEQPVQPPSKPGDSPLIVIAPVITAPSGTVAQPPPPPPPPPPQQAKNEEEKKPAKTDDEDPELKKRRDAAAPVLAKTTGRVTVILPPQK